jgi:hypothetical protein
MDKKLYSHKGTIANCLLKHMPELKKCENNINKMRETTLNLLNDPELVNNKHVEEAKYRISTAKDSALYSLISTYMIGERVM